jgi:CHAD domain-containing protein
VLEQQLHELPKDTAAADTFKRWNKAGKNLRKALQPVRDTDVYLAKLESLRDAAGMPGDDQKLSTRCLRELDKLESKLLKRREKKADALLAVIDEQGMRLSRTSEEMEAALAAQTRPEKGSNAQAAMRIFTRLAIDLPDLDRSNLHDYRKRLKSSLYLAESSAAADPRAERLAATFRKIHNATGEWHDWEALAEEAGRILPKRGGLVSVLEALADEALQWALDLCRSFAPRFPGNVPLGKTQEAGERDEQIASHG